MKEKINAGIGELIVSDNPNTILCAPNLGSCLGICAYDKHNHFGAMIHCLLPLSKSQPEKAKEHPTLFVDTGSVVMLNKFIERECNMKEVQIIVAGGAQLNESCQIFEIGKKNFTILRKVLWKNNLLLHATDVGDKVARTISLHIDTGEVFLKKNGVESKLSEG